MCATIFERPQNGRIGSASGPRMVKLPCRFRQKLQQYVRTLFTLRRWLHHHERCNDGAEHDIKPFRATTQYLTLAENQALLLKEYKAAKTAEK